MNAETVVNNPLVERDPINVKTPDSPGALRGEVWLSLQTHQAQILVHGRDALADKPAIIGLMGFADRLRIIWDAARHDDPYADWWLLKVDQSIRSTTEIIESQQKITAERLGQFIPMDVSVGMSADPIRISLRFANPYAYQAARSLARFDQLVCALVTANHVGLIAPAERARTQQSCARKLRRLFALPLTYRVMKLDRQTVLTRSGRAPEALKTMGEIPDDVLSGDRRAPFAPRCEPPATITDTTTASSLASNVPPRHENKNDNNR